MAASRPKILLFIFRNDLRLTDHPGLNALTTSQFTSTYTHVLPLYVFSPRQIEVSGLLNDKTAKSPYPPAKSRVGKFWRTGPHRVKFLAEGLDDLNLQLQRLNSRLLLRVGHMHEVVAELISNIRRQPNYGDVKGIWLTENFANEELEDEKALRNAVASEDIVVKLWSDNILIHLDDLPFKRDNVSDVFTNFRKSVEPIRDNIRKPLAAPTVFPPLPPYLPEQTEFFSIPRTLPELIAALQQPLSDIGIPLPKFPAKAKTAHPFSGGESTGRQRIDYLLQSGNMTSYKDTRNEMLGTDFSSKLSAWLAYGFISPVYINSRMVAFEDGSDKSLSQGKGFGKGENKGTAAMRFELLWRDYMRLCMLKYRDRMFLVHGFRNNPQDQSWKYRKDVQTEFYRWQTGTTGTGLIDAAQRELVLTGYQSNRARQNVASFLAKHLGIDWRLGAEWFEANLIDYDVASNWGNWQYTAGVGNDPRGENRVFNPIKQAHDYDPKGQYIKTWVEELSGVDDVVGLFQAWKLDLDTKQRCGGVAVQEPLKKINWHGGNDHKRHTPNQRGGRNHRNKS